MSLRNYHKKRNFQQTYEPFGKIKHHKNKKLLFVIQKHAASHLHYDFRLELNGVLLSWAIPKGPCLDPAIKRLAMHVENHPVQYGSFEGIIPKGQYGGGTVMLWDKGEWIAEEADPLTAYHNGNLTFTLKGIKLQGKWKLIRINHNDKTWLLIKIKDNYSRTIKNYDINIEEPNSILTNQSIQEIAENYNYRWTKHGLEKNISCKTSNKKKILIKMNEKSNPFPSKILPELATLVDKPPIGKKWLHEIKFDGYRLLAFKKNNKTKLFTRHHQDWTDKFTLIVERINNLPIKDIIFDGEIVVLDKNQHSDFQLLQNSIKENKDANFIYYIFDLLYYDKYDLMDLPLIKRKKMLHQIIHTSDDPVLRYSDHIIGSGKEIFEKSCELSLEGIISKDSTRPYMQKRSKDWLKIKCVKRQEFVIGGYTLPRKRKKYFGSLLLGTYNKKNELIYNGHVGTGFTETSLKDLHEMLEKIKTKNKPFSEMPPESKNAIWVKPIFVCEVEFIEWTQDNYLRHPSFKGLRSDKPAKSITKENEISLENTSNKNTSKKNRYSYTLSNPKKIIYSEDKITKQNLADYYYHIHTWILPYIINRPLTLVRCPEEYRKCFYQKHINKTTSAPLYGIPIKEKNKMEEYIYIKDVDGLMALSQLGTLEIHPWGSKIDEIEYPDTIVFDLDPALDISWKEVVAAAFDLKEELLNLKLKSFIKTTGGKGLHVVIPIKPEYEWSEIKNFTHVFADYMQARNPKKYINKMSKEKRKGKIFIDYLRNQQGATAIACYSTRAREHAPVATPLEWDELTNNIKDTFFTIKTLP
ncbi:MAG: DNA ligase D, partial [Gammaproteobacteria bacterium]|nr:DNA ligase D [Gammaproteobacteria bacterium]